jgi:hypothetical protein
MNYDHAISLTELISIIETMYSGGMDFYQSIVCDEVWFHLKSRYLKKILGFMHSVVIHEVPAHDSKIQVWCSVSLDIIIGLIFFGDIVLKGV